MVEDRLTNKDKKEWINLANVISCIAVLILHTNGCFWTFSKERYWYTANIIESVFYFAVPVFFMISGATLIDYRERYSTKEYFRKRIDKTLIPFIAWSLVGLAYKIALGVVQVSEINARYVWNGIVNTSIISIYWFFPVLFGIYLSIPLFAAVEKNLRKNVFAYAAVIGFGLGGGNATDMQDGSGRLFMELKYKRGGRIFVVCPRGISYK